MNISLNGAPRDVAEETTLADLVAQLDLEPRQVAIEVNESLIPREQHAMHRLDEGDRVEIVTLAGGG